MLANVLDTALIKRTDIVLVTIDDELNWSKADKEAPCFLEIAELSSLARIPVFNIQQGGLGGGNSIGNAFDQIRSLKRKYLILSGRLLEGRITQVCLSALAEGFDVAVLKDKIVSSDTLEFSTYMNRLIRSGALATTTRQLVIELILQEENPAIRSALDGLFSQR